MRKYLTRRNFDENNTDPLDVPERSVFFEKKRSKFRHAEKFENEENSKPEIKVNHRSQISTKQEITPNEKNKETSTLAKKLFQESFSAISEFNDKKMKLLYQQLEEEKKISRELNDKLNQNIIKISNAEIELIKNKNRLEGKLEEKTQELIKSERLSAIGELSARLAHDMRNPLSIITMILENLKDTYEVDEVKQKQFDKIDRAIDRITHQIDGVLDYVQKTPLKRESVFLKNVIQNSISHIRNYSNVAISVPEKDIIYKCDPIRMEIVFENILLNSIQAIGQKQGQINIKINEDSNSIIISIQDSGKGISKDNIQNMFEPLFTTKQEGTGLGLSSVKNIIEQHKGTISFSINPSIFTITLPK